MTAGTRTPILRDVVACPTTGRASSCHCVARGVVTVRGFGRATAAFYRNRLGALASAGRSNGGPRGRLTPDDFAGPEMQRAIIAAFEAALNEIASRTSSEVAA